MLEKLRQAMQDFEIQTLWVSNPANVRYLSNFSTPKDGKVLVTLEDAFLITDDRYLVQSKLESSLSVKIARFEAVLEFVFEIVQGRSLGFEADDTSYKQFDALRSLNAPLRKLIRSRGPLRRSPMPSTSACRRGRLWRRGKRLL